MNRRIQERARRHEVRIGHDDAPTPSQRLIPSLSAVHPYRRHDAGLHAILEDQYSGFALVRGLPCYGQPCQKQPSTNTATFAGPEHNVSPAPQSTQWLPVDAVYRNPIECRIRRTAISGVVSRVGCSCLRLRTPGVEPYEAASLLSRLVRWLDPGRPVK